MRPILALTLLAAPLLAQEDEAAARTAAAEISTRLASSSDDEKLVALREAAQCQHSALIAPLVKLLKHRNPAVRTATIEALGLRSVSADKKRASRALAARIKPLESKAEDKKQELLAVCQALHDLAQPNSLKPLLDKISIDADQDVARARLMAAANIPDKEVIERLITLADSGRRHAKWRQGICRQALTYATGQKIRGGVEQWRKWWRENKRDWDVVKAAEEREQQRTQRDEKERQREERRRKKEERRRKKDAGDGGG
jgi:hypothetical protein